MKSLQLKSSSLLPQYEAPDTCVHTIECGRILIVTSNTGEPFDDPFPYNGF